MRHDPGLAASPPVRYILEVERSGCSSFHSPSAVYDIHPNAWKRNSANFACTEFSETHTPLRKPLLPKPSDCWLGSPGVLEISRAGAGAGTNPKRASCRQCRWSLSPERFLPGRIDHLGLPCDYRAQNFLLFRLGHIEVVERTADLRSNLVELFRSDMEVLVGFVQLPARVGKGPHVTRLAASRG